uniref:Uncharacterized protein n=1 Tax=Arundo donax TaxID=35708 RepID=A0A0A9LZQ2_ARUDO
MQGSQRLLDVCTSIISYTFHYFRQRRNITNKTILYEKRI